MMNQKKELKQMKRKIMNSSKEQELQHCAKIRMDNGKKSAAKIFPISE